MSERNNHSEQDAGDLAPGEEGNGRGRAFGAQSYLVGFALASALTAASFLAANTDVIWGPAIPAALIALAVAQMGIQLVFFLHITTGPDNTNNVLALAFGVLIVLLVMIGTIWIIAHLNHNMMPMDASARGM